MQMYLFRNPSFPANGMSGDDADVLFHEYTHGLSNRADHGLRRGARVRLNSAQAGGDGRGPGSDWYAQGLQSSMSSRRLDTSFAG